MDKSRQQFEEWRSKNKSSTINLFDVWQASRESLIGTEVSIDLNLPTDPHHRIFGNINGFNQSNHELVILIEANEDGVKIKNG
ncbi:hypothetical protein GKR71_00325 [Providencia sp. wls1922]|uniref:hypothetical protein n=1 Tax=Providencia sp. wls1922 TaxID=2675152 RepID=UPI0012B5D014|nr:hypothetical protein [Providencia sp. wls1922]MTC44285.1 hypothetical protein [Providencia sp. wls1922]